MRPLILSLLALALLASTACVMPDPTDPENPWSVFADVRTALCLIVGALAFLFGGALTLKERWARRKDQS